MQAACPQCSQKIVIDDAKVPDRAFSVKCPKCQNVVRFPGRGAAEAAPAAADPFAAPPPGPTASEMRPEAIEQLKKEIARTAGGLGRALVALPDRNAGASVNALLTQLGISVDSIDNPDEGGRLLEQGLYSLVVTSRVAAAPGKETLLQRVTRLSPEARRRVFLVVLGEELRSGDAAMAFAGNADLVLNPRDVGSSLGQLLASALGERKRLYQVYLDARERFEAAAAH